MFSDLRAPRLLSPHAEVGGSLSTVPKVPAIQFLQGLQCDDQVAVYRDMMATYVRPGIELSPEQQKGVVDFLERLSRSLDQGKKAAFTVDGGFDFGRGSQAVQQGRLAAEQATSSFVTMLNSMQPA